MSSLHFIPVSEEVSGRSDHAPSAPGVEAGVEADRSLCESCARPDADLAEVHRMYVVPASWDTEGSEKVLAEVEIWCFSCRSIYAHRPIS